jgi:predicted nucleic acid-binding Zn ribbon protein
MTKGNEYSVGDAIREFLHTFRLEDKLLERQVIASWEKVMGRMVANHTTRLYIRRKVLHVAIDSPALRNELSYGREKIQESLNREVNAVVITDVVFH